MKTHVACLLALLVVGRVLRCFVCVCGFPFLEAPNYTFTCRTIVPLSGFLALGGLEVADLLVSLQIGAVHKLPQTI